MRGIIIEEQVDISQEAMGEIVRTAANPLCHWKAETVEMTSEGVEYIKKAADDCKEDVIWISIPHGCCGGCL